jgi:hypothetical protein
MAQFIKHVGVDGKGRKCIVAFREVPGDSENCLIIPTEGLPDLYHNDLIQAIESVGAQDAIDVNEYLFRQKFHDGTNMLNTVHQNGWMQKVATKSVMMTPQPGVTINLVELNKQLRLINAAPQQAKEIAESATPPGVLSDQQIASKMRSQANTFEIEARRLREEADKLDPKPQAAATLTVVPPSAEKRGRGRPPKVKAPA